VNKYLELLIHLTAQHTRIDAEAQLNK